MVATGAKSVGRPKIQCSVEESKAKRRAQIARCKENRKKSDPLTVKAKSALQRWHYRRTHPESRADELAKLQTKREAERKVKKKQQARLDAIRFRKTNRKWKLFRD